MKSQLGIIVLVLVCVGLIIALVANQKKAADQHSVNTVTLSGFSNELRNTGVKLEEARQVNAALNKDLDTRKSELATMTNHLNEASNKVLSISAKIEDTLKAAQSQVAQRDAKIADLESQNHSLDQHLLELSTAITNLTDQIEGTRKELAASKGDKAFLQRELHRLMSEKAVLEEQFKQLKLLRVQIAKLKEEQGISRRLRWIREGYYSRDQKKGAQLLMEKTPNVAASKTSQPKSGKYDLNVEINSDGTVRVIPPPTNAPAPTNPPPQ